MSDPTDLIAPPRPLSRRAQKVRRDETVRRLKRKLIRVVPGGRLARPEFGPVIETFAQLSVLKQRIYLEQLHHKPLTDALGNVRGAVDFFRRLCVAQLQSAAALGLTPASAALMADVGASDILGELGRNDKNQIEDAEVVGQDDPPFEPVKAPADKPREHAERRVRE